MSGCSLKSPAECGGLCRHDGRWRFLAPFRPRLCGSLRVHVNQDRAVAGKLGGNRDMQRESGFAGSALLADHGDGSHAGMLLCCRANTVARRHDSPQGVDSWLASSRYGGTLACLHDRMAARCVRIMTNPSCRA
jgi:hypothetical protein